MDEHVLDFIPGGDSTNEQDDARGPDYPSPTSLQRRGYTSISREDEREAAMDELNYFFMSLQPQEVANRRKEEELKAREASRSKVDEWLITTKAGRL